MIINLVVFVVICYLLFWWCLQRVCRYERVAPGEQRVIVVVNAARKSWQGGEYGLWVGGGGTFKQVYCSQVSLHELTTLA